MLVKKFVSERKLLMYVYFQEVVCCMNRNPKLPCPGELDFVVISALIRELCCLAYSMQTLIPPLDIAYGVDGECFNRNM